MSRRLLSPPRRNPIALEDNSPYKPTTLNIQKHQKNGATRSFDPTSEDDSLVYEYCQYQDSRYFATDRSFSDESGSTRIPGHYENDDDSIRRFSRNTYASDRRRHDKVILPTAAVHGNRRIYPQHNNDVRVYHEINSQPVCENVPAAPRRAPVSRLSDRPQSSMSSEVTSAIVDGCGGKCQTFENVCYFFLQLIFMMGILIGVSLCIAGLVLRKSAARNLQVLVYIGILLALVSAVLLGIQWNSRNSVKKRKMAVRNGKRAPIPLETLNPRSQQIQQQQQQPLVVIQEGQRVVPQILRPLPPAQPPDQQGIPWWRRKDLQ